MVVLHLGERDDLHDAAPALRRLAAAFPEHHRVLAGPAALASEARRIAGIDMIIDTPGLEPLHPGLHGADIAVNLEDAGPESIEILLATGPKRLVSFGVEGGPVWDADEPATERWCRLLDESGIGDRVSADLGR